MTKDEATLKHIKHGVTRLSHHAQALDAEVQVLRDLALFVKQFSSNQKILNEVARYETLYNPLDNDSLTMQDLSEKIQELI